MQMMIYRGACKLLLAAAIVASGTPIAFTQTIGAPAAAPAFEVATIKPNKTGNGRWRSQFTPYGFTAMSVSLKYVIQEAYGIYDDHRWSGGPAWLNSDKWDIEAKFDASEFKDPTPEQRKSMLQTLLADRCKLVIHHEIRESSVYALVLAKKGPKFQASKPENIIQSNLYGKTCLLSRRPGDRAFQGCSMQDLAQVLMRDVPDLGRTAVDKTGLTDRYDFELRWRQDTTSPSEMPDSSEPSIFTALQEQLGLKLKSARAPLDILVIDQVEMPSEN
jgi:uncharacterized protein (TIGR03435 family)